MLSDELHVGQAFGISRDRRDRAVRGAGKGAEPTPSTENDSERAAG